MSARCSPAYCSCDSEGCDTNYEVFIYAAELRLDSDRLVGTARGDWTNYSLTMERLP